MSLRIAILGAAGTVGHEILQVLAEKPNLVSKIFILANRDSIGKEVSFGDRVLRAQDAEAFDFASVDLVFLSLGDRAARKWASKIAPAGPIIIDLSAAFRMDADVPLLCPDANPQDALKLGPRRIVSIPGGAAAQLAPVLKPLNDAVGVRRVTAMACLAVSERGRPAVDELWVQTKGMFVNQSIETKEFAKQIAFNIIPHVGDFLDNGSTEEEQNITDEVRKILGTDLRIASTCVQVPVYVGHSLAVHMELGAELSIPAIRSLLRDAPGLVVVDNREEETFVTPVETVGEWVVYVSRIRTDTSVPNGVALWIVSDNLRKGAAMNAVEAAELLMRAGAFAKPVAQD